MESYLRKYFCVLDSDIICELKTISHADRPDFNVSGINLFPDRRFHNHDGYEILIMLDGEMNYYTENNGKRIRPGDIICLNPYTFHCGVLLTPETYDRIVINIRESVMKELSSAKTDLSTCFNHFEQNKLNVFHVESDQVKQFTDYALKLQNALKSDEFGSDILIKIYIQQILLLLNQQLICNERIDYGDNLPVSVADTFIYIEEHITEKITLQDLANNAHQNGTYLSRCFKKITGISIQQYIIIKKINLAQKFLREGYPPSEVCDMVGFNNYSNFSRTFSKYAGSSPKQYQSKYFCTSRMRL